MKSCKCLSRAARTLAPWLIAASSVVSNCLAKVRVRPCAVCVCACAWRMGPFCVLHCWVRAQVDGVCMVCTYENTRDLHTRHTQVRTAVVLPHGDFVYAPQLIDYKNGSRQLHCAARVMALGERAARAPCMPLLR